MSPIDSIAPGLPGTTNRTSGTAPTSGTPVDANVTPDAAVTGGGAGVATRYDSAPVIAKSGATGFLDAVDNGYRQTSAQTHERSIAAIQAKGSAGDGRTASLRDLANLGVFSNADLTELAQAGLSGVELGQLHDMAAQEIVRNYAAESSGAAKVTAPAAGVDAGGAKAPTPEDMAAQSRGASTDRPNAVPAPALAGTPQAVAVEQAWDADVRAAFAKAGASDQTTNAMIQDAVTSGFDDAGYQQLYAYLQTPKAATDIATFQAQAATGAVDPATGQPVASAAAARGPSAWSDAWATKFRDVMRAQGASGKVIVTVLQQLKASKPSEQMLTEALTQLSKPTAKAAIKQLNADAKTQSASELRTKFILMGGALVGGAAIMGIKASTGAKNLTNQISALTHDLPSKSKIATAARTALDQTASVEARTAARALTRTNLLQRAEALKLAGNASEAKAVLRAASSLKPGQAMTLKEALTFGVMYRSPRTAAGIVEASQAARSASTTSATTAAGAATKAGGAAATAAKGGAAGIEAAAKGASTLSKVGGFLGKALGPISIAVTAAFGIWEISKTVKAEGGFGKESAKKTGEVSGNLAGGIGGAAGGAALGTLLLPGAGTLIGGIIGGIIGSTGGGMLGSLFGGGIHDAIEGADGVKGAAKG